MDRFVVIATCALTAAVAGCSSTTPGATSSLAATGTPSASPSVTVLNEVAAADRYMTIICPTNRATDEWVKAVDDSPIGSAMTSEFRKETRELARTYRQAAKQLVDSDYKWPENVDALVERMAEIYYQDSAALSDAAGETTVTDIPWSNNRSAASKVRLRLGLPPAGTGCKKYLVLADPSQ